MKPLFHGLLMRRVRPYYLYQCDPITGSSHFRTSVDKGLEIIEGLRGHTTGYAVPTYVIDAPGGGGKIPLIPDYVVGREGDDLILRNFEGKTYRYTDPDGTVGADRAMRHRASLMRIGLVYDLRDDYRALGFSEEAVAEFDTVDTIDQLAGALAELGCEVVRVGRGQALAARLVAGDRYDLVFSIAEGVKGRSREAQVPALCELFDQPYLFSDPLTMTACLDKASRQAAGARRWRADAVFRGGRTQRRGGRGVERVPGFRQAAGRRHRQRLRGGFRGSHQGRACRSPSRG